MKKDKEMPEVEVEIKGPEMESEDDGEDMKEYEIECAMEDLLRAAKHKRNPKLMAAVSKKLMEKKADIESIADLKQKRNEMFTKDKA